MERLRMTERLIPSIALVIGLKCCQQPFVRSCAIWTDQLECTCFLFKVSSPVLGLGHMSFYYSYDFLAHSGGIDLVEVALDQIRDGIKYEEENYIA